jgi:NADPH-dependent glutamate synthase beta subunit-like oxidoreductase
MIKDSQFAIPISYGSTEVIDTGKWGFQKPHPQFLTAPCQEACPAGNSIPQFLYLAQKGEYGKALLTILKENPFPGICGRVCFHPCEASCNRGEYDESVSINALERYIFDTTIDQEPNLNPVQNGNGKRVAVVGAGPAGLSCAYFLRLLGHKVTVFEAYREAGGIMAYGIPEYRLPKDIVKKEIARIMALGIDIKTSSKVGRDITFDALNEYDAAFLSMGAGISSLLGIEGETFEKVMHGLDFLMRVNSGSSIPEGKDVIVVGGGNTAMDVARSSLRNSCRVTIAYRRGRPEMPAIKDEIDDAEEEGVRFEFLIQPVRINMLPDKRLAVTFRRMKLGEPDASGRPRAIPVEETDFIMETDYLFTAAGENVDLVSLPKDLTKNGLIYVDTFLRTKNTKMFAGGDVVDQPRTIVTAIGAGKKAAISIDLNLKGSSPEKMFSGIQVGNKGSLSFEAYTSGGKFEMFRAAQKVVTFDKLNTLYFEHSERVKKRKLNRETALQNFQEVNLGLLAEEATASASRCFTCGTCNYCYNCYFFCPEGVILLDPIKGTKYVDYDHCKGCGTCAKSCPRSVVVMKEL